MQNNKIILVSSVYGLGMGGIETWAHYIGKLLKQHGCKVHSYGLRGESLHYLCRLVLDSLSSRIFICMTWKVVLAFIPALLLTGFKKRKFFIIVHGDDILGLSLLQNKVLKFICTRSNTYIIANSKHTSGLLKSAIGQDADRVFHPFIKIEKINQPPVTFKHDKLKILTLSRIAQRKNIISVIRALEILDQNGMNFVYDIAGTGEELHSLKKYAKSTKINNKINFLGSVTEVEKNDLYKNSSIFVLPSLYDSNSIEGYGIVYIEANSYGTPVISGNTGGAVEAVINGVTGVHTDGGVESIIDAFLTLEKGNIKTQDLFSHAEKHDYRSQSDFASYISQSGN